MSPRAAWRLEAYAYHPVFDYVAGKADWLAFNLPRQGWADLAGDHLSSDIPTCGPGDRLTDIRHLFEDHPLGLVVALNHLGIVMGTVNTQQLETSDPDSLVGEVMWEGPSTVRPSEETEALSERMRNADVDAVLVTSSDGKLLGLYRDRRAPGPPRGP